MHTSAFIAVFSGEQVWTMGLLLIKSSPVKQYSYQKDFSGVHVFDKVFLLFVVLRLFEEKRGDVVFGFPCFRGYVVSSPSNSRFLVCATPLTVLCRSF